MKKKLSLYLMVFFYIATGVNHFVMPSFYLAIVPYYLPFPLELVYVSGVVEVVLATMLLYKTVRRIAAWLIILMLLAFTPVHIQMLLDNSQTLGISFWVALTRIPIQILLIYWAWTFARKKANEDSDAAIA